MTVWRMSMRFGNQGYEMWPQCEKKGVAAIGYGPFVNVDLRKTDERKLAKLWAKLERAQRGFLRRVAYDMAKGDVIYIKQGTQIVGKGVVLGPYQFDTRGEISNPEHPDLPFAHQVPVKWDPKFTPIAILLGSEPSTVLKLSGARLRKLEAAIAASRRATRDR